MQLILLPVGVSTVPCNACERVGRCLHEFEFLGDSGHGDFGAAEEEPAEIAAFRDHDFSCTKKRPARWRTF